MTKFTDSCFENMMIQRPSGIPGKNKYPHVSQYNKCKNCNYINSRHCIGICAKELDLIKVKK